MALTANVLSGLVQGSSADAWRTIIDQALHIASRPLAAGNAPSEVVRRDREIGELDLFLASSGWDLWQAFGESVERTSERLVRWWTEPFRAKAVLIQRISGRGGQRRSSLPRFAYRASDRNTSRAMTISGVMGMNNPTPSPVPTPSSVSALVGLSSECFAATMSTARGRAFLKSTAQQTRAPSSKPSSRIA